MSTFHTDSRDANVTFIYPSQDHPSLAELRKLVSINTGGFANSSQKASAIIGYAHSLFEHSSHNEPSSFDPLVILREAGAGAAFRCVEHSYLAAALLLAHSVPARMTGLMMRDVETRKFGAAHVVVEHWNGEQGSWVMSDVQAGVVPVLGGRRLGAVELGEALREGAAVELERVKGSRFLRDGMFKDEQDYLGWIKEYLCFYDTALRMRLHYTFEQRRDEQKLMLVPRGVEPPRVFQASFTMNMVYTNSLSDFYPVPDDIEFSAEV